MRMSDAGIEAMLKKFEGCKLKAYKCPAGILTIGFGHTSAAGEPIVTPDLVITKQEALDILHRDLKKFEEGVDNLVKVHLTQNQYDVLVDFAYNAGIGALKSSSLLKKVNAGDFDAVPAELMKWTKGKIPGKGSQVLPGLVNRRNAEVAWWNNGEATPAVTEDHRSEPDAPAQRTMAESKQGNAALLTAGLGSVGVAKEVAAQAKDASDTADQLMGLLHNSNFVIMVAIIGLGAAIWFWRKKHMEEHGV